MRAIGYEEKASVNNEEIKDATAAEERDTSNRIRGGGMLLKYVKRQNIIMFWGCRIGEGIDAETNMVAEIAHIFSTRYDKNKFIL